MKILLIIIALIIIAFIGIMYFIKTTLNNMFEVESHYKGSEENHH